VIGAALFAAALASQPAAAAPLAADELGRRYWRAVAWGRRASNLTCSLDDFPRYDDPASPFRRNDKRLRAIARVIAERDEAALAAGRAGILMAPPNSICDDPQGARVALETYERQVTELEQFVGLSAAGG
jgi:hypothetical protein